MRGSLAVVSLCSIVFIGSLGTVGGCGALGKPPSLAAKTAANSAPQAVDIPVAPPNDTQPVTLGAAVSRTRVEPGETIVLVVRCKTSSPWHIYACGEATEGSSPTQLALQLPDSVSMAADWQLPTASSNPSPLGNIETYAGDFRFTVPLAISPTAAAGPVQVTCDIRYQACSDVTCLAPGSQRLVIPLTVQPSGR